MAEKNIKPSTKEAPVNIEPNETGLRSVKTTTAFRIVNFELFAKPNKRVMGTGGAVFLLCCSYIFYLNVTDEYKNTKTYTVMNDDGSMTRRIKQSKWD